jgi:ADP-ribose pyrophosphatase YjhB (NUDIX family)
MKLEHAEELFVRFFLNASLETLSTIQDFAIVLEKALYFHKCVHKRIHRQQIHKPEWLKEAQQFFRHIPALNCYLSYEDRLWAAKEKLKKVAKPYGCIVFDQTFSSVLVVHHVMKTNVFSFPKGKAREGETPLETAVRETFEETGIDLSAVITDKYPIECERHGRASCMLFMVWDVQKVANLKPPKTSEEEIAMVRWADISDVTKKGEYVPDGPTRTMLPAIERFAKKMRRGKSVEPGVSVV